MSTRVHFLRDAALVFADGHDSGRHAHRALQLTLGLDGPFRHRSPEGGWVEAAFRAFVPEEPHHVACDGRIAYLFIDRAPRRFGAFADPARVDAPPPELVDALQQAAHRPLSGSEAQALARRWEQACLPGLRDGDTVHDARLADLLAAIERDPAAPTNHRALARQVHLSTSRFAERFRAATGMPVRNYLLWRRLLRAVELLQAGASATGAAHAAGFSDAAHLSRSFRRILGAAPSALIAAPGP